MAGRGRRTRWLIAAVGRRVASALESLVHVQVLPSHAFDEAVALQQVDMTDDDLRAWAFDRDFVFVPQHEAVVLARARYVPVLIELVNRPDCPKRDLIGESLCLWVRNMTAVALASEEHLELPACREALLWLSSRLQSDTGPARKVRRTVSDVLAATEAPMSARRIQKLLGCGPARAEGAQSPPWRFHQNGATVVAQLHPPRERQGHWQTMRLDGAPGWSFEWWIES